NRHGISHCLKRKEQYAQQTHGSLHDTIFPYRIVLT
ncbi:MAG: hypothetical protein ACI9G1_005367, partial [Pirellulaceae bacterium]